MRTRVLFLAPVMPAEGGNGLAMRAGLCLDALAAAHVVSLLVVPAAGPAVAPTAFVTDRAVRTVVLRLAEGGDPEFRRASRLADPVRRVAALRAYPAPALCRFATTEAVAAAARAFGGERFDVVHVMRLYLVPFAEPFLGRDEPRSVLDLDDDEVATRRQLATLHRRRGDAAAMVLEAAEADKYETLAREWLPRFDRILVCAAGDRQAVARRWGLSQVVVVPNGVRVPAKPAGPPARVASVLRLLFVGSLGYAPNEDAAQLLCEEILPRVRARVTAGVCVRLVGSHPSPAVSRLAEIRGVTLYPNVPSVAPFYAEADVAVVPVRAGGGTRIKVLEAFAHRVPVVSTTLGAEGLEVEAGTHLLVADDPDGLAEACRRLWEETALVQRLTTEAAGLTDGRYSTARVAEIIRALYRELST